MADGTKPDFEASPKTSEVTTEPAAFPDEHFDDAYFQTLAPRLFREYQTLVAVVKIFCQDLHKSGKEHCPECEKLFRYAVNRLRKCPFQERKPSCSQCRIHCYSEPHRTQIRELMRYSGPRLLWRKPWLSLCHLADTLKGRWLGVPER